MKKLNKRGKITMNVSGVLGIILIMVGAGSLDAGTMGFMSALIVGTIGLGLLFLSSSLYSVETDY